MSRFITLPAIALALGLWSCHRDAPTAPAGTRPPSDALPAPELAGFALALEDLRDRIVPTLGNGPVVDALGSALEDVRGALAAPDPAALEGAVARAHAAATQLPADSSVLPDLDVVRLVLADIIAAARGSAESVPNEAANPTREP
jgi:hypothetical protein